MKYTVLTELNVFDSFSHDSDYDEYISQMVNSQYGVLASIGFDDTYSKAYCVRFNNERTYNMTIDDAIQSLSLKEGADLVRFENGNIGFVGYYGDIPTERNCFEILGDYDESLG